MYKYCNFSYNYFFIEKMPISIKIENIFDTHTLTCYCNTSLVRQQPTDYIWSWKKQVNDKIDDKTELVAH